MNNENVPPLLEMLKDLNLKSVLTVIDELRKHPEVVSIEIKTKDQAIAEVKGEC